MADRKISDLTALTTPASGDYLPIVDISEASAANKNKRITIEELLRGAPDGTAGAPGIGFESDPNTGIYSPGADQVAISTGGTGRLFITSAGLVGIGTSTARAGLTVGLGSDAIPAAGASTGSALFSNATGAGAYGLVVGATSGGLGYVQAQRADGTATTYNLALQPNGGSVGIGTASPVRKLSVSNDGAEGIEFAPGLTSNVNYEVHYNRTAAVYVSKQTEAAQHIFNSATGEAARIDSSGRLLVGTSSARSNVNLQAGDRTPLVQIETATDSYNNGLSIINNSAGGYAPQLSIGLSLGSAIGSNTNVAPSTAAAIGIINFVGNDGGQFLTGARIEAVTDAATGNDDMPCRLVFSTTADGASSPTERLRITQSGFVNIGSQGTDIIWNQTSATGVTIGTVGVIQVARSNDQLMLLNRIGNDGTLITFAQDGAVEGDISISGSTVSYNGAHLSRWSQLPGGAERTEILRGSVLSNIDEMCEWGNEDNEQLNRMKVSDVEGDKNVSGVFQCWDDDDDTYTNDFYCAMTGDFIIRIAAGVTVERGDLLMSAGDGTAKPQDDDIIRSKTIAKVTSTNVSCTYDDGSYCVPCVLMAC